MWETSRRDSTMKTKKNEGNVRDCVVEFRYVLAVRIIVLEEKERS